MSASLYEPINVYKPLAESIGIVDGPFEYLTVAGLRMPLPFTTRMTVIRLASGELFLHSPIAFDAALAEQLRAMGKVRHLISPNQFHYAHIGEWQRAFPDTIAWASPRARQRARSRHVEIQFDRNLDPAPPADWNAEIDQILIPGGIFKEFAFFHRPSRTLVLTDTIMNLELDKLDQPWRLAARLSGMSHPGGGLFFGMRLAFLLQPRKTRSAIARVREWRPERVVISHGQGFSSDAEAAIRRVFGIAT